MSHRPSLKIFHSFLLALFIWGCDSIPPSLPVENIILSQETKERLEKAERPIFVHWYNTLEDSKNFDFDCKDCPDSIGQLIVKSDIVEIENGKEVDKVLSGNCQGGLVAEDLFLTNRHCLPVDLQIKGSSCNGRAQVIFPKKDADSQIDIVECENVVDLFPLVPGFAEKDAQPDWALLKLKSKLPNRVSEVSSEGVQDQQKLFAYVPLRSIENDFFNIEKITCVVDQKSVLMLLAENEKSPIQLAHCDKDITKGFSGTLLFDSEEKGAKVAAVISHIWDEGRGEDDVIISRNVIISNLHCLPQEGKETEDHCQFNKDRVQEIKLRFGRRLLERAHQRSVKLFEEWIKSSQTPIEWEKIDIEHLDKLPENYEHFFVSNRELKEPPYGLSNSDLMTAVAVPFYPKCVKDKTPKEIILPSIDFQISSNTKNHPRPYVQLMHNKGRLHANTDEEFVLLIDEKQERLPRTENTLLTGPYFSHSVYLSPCE